METGLPVLLTERLTLRAPCRADVKAITRLAADRRVAANTARIPHPYRLSDAEQFIAAINRRHGEAVFVIAVDDEPIGCAVSSCAKARPRSAIGSGCRIWGSGYATEAARAVIDHAFGALGHETLQAGARVSNPASRRVLEKCGFQWTGVGLYRIPAINSSAPFDRFRLDRGLWASLKAWGRAREVA